MSTTILMPALSPTMTEGTLARWLVREGDAIAAGDVIAEIETDKATMEVEAVDEGVLGRILVADGTEGVAVNAPIGIIVADGETVPDTAPPAAAPAAPAPGTQDSASRPPGAAPPASPSPARVSPAVPVPQGNAVSSRAPEGGGYGAVGTQPAVGRSGPAPATPSPATPRAGTTSAGQGRVFASPLARRLATQAGLDLATLAGTGPNGRIVRRDIESAPTPAASSPAHSAAPESSAAPGLAARAGGPPVIAPAPTPPRPSPVVVAAAHRRLPNSNVRRTIARRLSESKQFTPHFYCSVDVELDALLALRGQLNDRSPAEGPARFKISVNDLLIKACAATLRQVPGVNASYTDEAILQFDDVDISVAVSIPDGLITPIIRNADRKGLAAISSEARDLVARARAGKLKPEEFQGGTFSISNMGMYGVRDFAAIINPPQGGILAVGAGEQRAVVRGDALAIATVMTVTLSVDHRCIDGALAAQWVAAFRRLVEDPLSLML